MSSQSIVTQLVLLTIIAGVIFWVAFWPRIRLQRIYRQAFPSTWQSILEKRLPFTAKLTPELKQQLQNLVKLFMADKKYIGCGGLKINDDIRVTIAAQACLLILNRPNNQYSDLQSILVYPSTFVASREIRDDLGLVSTNHIALLGESWSQGKVILAWDNVEKGVCNFHDGHNVVLHEFAHQLDNESGSHNGAPLLNTRGAYKSWAHIFATEFENLQQDAVSNRRNLLDHYGSTNPAEFFAVATETFFERPLEMHQQHSELYRQLMSFYRLDPRLWH